MVHSAAGEAVKLLFTALCSVSSYLARLRRVLFYCSVLGRAQRRTVLFRITYPKFYEIPRLDLSGRGKS